MSFQPAAPEGAVVHCFPCTTLVLGLVMVAEAQAIVPVTPASLHCLVTSPYDTVSQRSRFNQQHRSACCLRLGATAVVTVLTA